MCARLFHSACDRIQAVVPNANDYLIGKLLEKWVHLSQNAFFATTQPIEGIRYEYMQHTDWSDRPALTSPLYKYCFAKHSTVSFIVNYNYKYKYIKIRNFVSSISFEACLSVHGKRLSDRQRGLSNI